MNDVHIRYILSWVDRGSRAALARDKAIRDGNDKTAKAAVRNAGAMAGASRRWENAHARAAARIVYENRSIESSTNIVSRSVDRAGGALGRFMQKSQQLTRDLHRMNIVFSAFRNLMMSLRLPLAITSLGLMTQALGATAGAAVALTGALGPLSGALIALPAIASGVAQGMATIQGAFSGIKDTLSAFKSMQTSAGGAASSAADAMEAAAERVHDAERRLADAKERSEDAERDLTRARKEAKREIIDLALAAEGAANSELRAQLSLREAKAEADRTSADPTSSALERQSALLGVVEAETAVKDAAIQRGRAVAEAGRADQAGVKGSDRVKDAARQRKDATADLAEAARDLRRAQQEAAKGPAASGGADRFGALYANLSKEAQQFVTYWTESVQPMLKGLSADAGRELFPGLIDGIKAAQGSLPELSQVLQMTGGVFGDLAREAGKVFGSDAFGKAMLSIGKANAGWMRELGGAAIRLAPAMADLLVAAQPFLDWMVKGTVKFADLIGNFAKAGAQSGRFAGFLERTRSVMTTLWHSTRDFAAGLLEIFGIGGRGLGTALLGDLEKLMAGFREWTESTSGQNQIRQWFEDITPAVYGVIGLIGDLGGMFIRLAAQPGVRALIDEIRNVLLPTIERVIVSTTEAFGPSLVGFLDAVLQMFSALHTPLSVAIKGLAWFLDKLAAVANAKLPDWLGGVKPFQIILTVLIGIAVAMRAMRFLAVITGLTKVAAGFRAVHGRAREAAVASAEFNRNAAAGMPPLIRNRKGQILDPTDDDDTRNTSQGFRHHQAGDRLTDPSGKKMRGRGRTAGATGFYRGKQLVEYDQFGQPYVRERGALGRQRTRRLDPETGEKLTRRQAIGQRLRGTAAVQQQATAQVVRAAAQQDAGDAARRVFVTNLEEVVNGICRCLGKHAPGKPGAGGAGAAVGGAAAARGFGGGGGDPDDPRPTRRGRLKERAKRVGRGAAGAAGLGLALATMLPQNASAADGKGGGIAGFLGSETGNKALIAASIASLLPLGRAFGVLRKVASLAVRGIAAAVRGLPGVVRGAGSLIGQAFGAIGSVLRSVGGFAKSGFGTLTSVLRAAGGVIRTVGGAIGRAIAPIFRTIISGVRLALPWIARIAPWLLRLSGPIGIVLSLVFVFRKQIWGAMKFVAEKVADGVRAIGRHFRKIPEYGAAVLQFFRDLPGNIASAVSGLASKIGDIGKSFGGWIIDGIKAGFGEVVDLGKALMGVVAGQIDKAIPDSIPFVSDNPLKDAGLYAAGGWVVPGDPRSDSTLALLAGDEVVITGDGQRQMASAAPGLLESVVSAQAPHFARGGYVGAIPRFKGGGRADMYAIRRAAQDSKMYRPDLLYGVYGQESAFGTNPGTSDAGALGPFQFMPATARGMGLRDRMDFKSSARAAARYLNQLKSQFKDWRLAVAAYNAGPGNVEKYGGIPPFKETQAYVPAVYRFAGRYDLGKTTDKESRRRARANRKKEQDKKTPSPPAPSGDGVYSVWERGVNRRSLTEDAMAQGVEAGVAGTGIRTLLRGIVESTLQTGAGRFRAEAGPASGADAGAGADDVRRDRDGKLRTKEQRSFASMLAAANRIDAARYPYAWGGGHAAPGRPGKAHTKVNKTTGRFETGYDCSGAVGAVLYAGGLDKGARHSSGWADWGLKGMHTAARGVSVLGNSGHVIMKLGRRFWGTSGQNYQGGAGWLTGNTMTGSYYTRHANLARTTGGRSVSRAGATRGKGQDGPNDAAARTPGSKPGHRHPAPAVRPQGMGIPTGTMLRPRPVVGGMGIPSYNPNAGAAMGIPRRRVGGWLNRLSSFARGKGRKQKVAQRGPRPMNVVNMAATATSETAYREVLTSIGLSLETATMGTVKAYREQVIGRINALMRKPQTSVRDQQILRMRGVLDSLDARAGEILGAMTASFAEGVAVVTRKIAGLQNHLRQYDIDAASTGATAAVAQLVEEQTWALIQQQAAVRHAADEARSMGNEGVAASFEAQYAEVTEALTESWASLAEAQRARTDAIVDVTSKAVEKTMQAYEKQRTQQTQFFRTFNIDESSSGAQQALSDLLQQQVAGMGAQRDALLGALAQAQASGSRSMVAQIEEQLTEIADTIAETVVAQIEAARAAVLARAQENVDRVNRVASLGANFDPQTGQGLGGSTGQATLEIQQQLAGTFDTAGGRAARAEYIRATIMPGMEQQLVAMRAQRQTALDVGDESLADQLAQAIGDKQNEILGAQLSAQQLIEENTREAADTLKEFSGSTSFDLNGTRFTDLINSGVGA